MRTSRGGCWGTQKEHHLVQFGFRLLAKERDPEPSPSGFLGGEGCRGRKITDLGEVFDSATRSLEFLGGGLLEENY